MAAITFPINPTRLNYTVNPWVDPSGKPWIWNQSQSSWSLRSVAILLRSAVPVNSVTDGTLGQTCIVTHTDGSLTEWGCVGTSPFKWLPRTPGVLLNTDTGLYERTIISAGSFISTPLPV